MRVTKLFVKNGHGEPLQSVPTMRHDQSGIWDNVTCAPFRQVLIVSEPVTASLGLKPGDLRENVVVDFGGLYDLPSGSVVKIGDALIRLTFHCEPCKQILGLVEFDLVEHKRGVLGCFLNEGAISVGDEFFVTDQLYEAIPYAMNERLQWFLKHHDMPSAALDVIHKIGLPASFAKIMPRMLQRHFLRS